MTVRAIRDEPKAIVQNLLTTLCEYPRRRRGGAMCTVVISGVRSWSDIFSFVVLTMILDGGVRIDF